MKKTLFIVAVIALIAIAVWQLSMLCSNKESKPEVAEEESITALDIIAMEHDAISEALEGVPLNTSAITITDFRGNPLSLSDAIGAGKSALIARFSATGCRPCVERLMAGLEDFCNSHPDSDTTVIVVAASVYARDLNVFEAQYSRKMRFFGAEEFPLDFGEAISPYSFFVDDKGVISEHTILTND